MHNHRGRPTDTSHFVHILMRGHHASGGAAPAAMGTAKGNMLSNTSHYRKGGKTHRSRHAEGDMTGVSPITGERSPDVLAKRRGGRACHAEGDMVAKPQKRGGRTHRRRSHHGFGDFIHGVSNIGSKVGNFVQNTGNKIGNLGQNIKKGINYATERHADGDTVELAAGGAGKIRKGMLNKNYKIIKNY